MSRAIAALTVLTVAGSALLLSPPQAGAVDHRPCVSKREFNAVPGGLPRAQMETRWDVRGRAIERPSVYAQGTLPTEFARIYEACGYDVDQAWVTVFYDKSTRQMTAKYRVITGDAVLTGHP